MKFIYLLLICCVYFSTMTYAKEINISENEVYKGDINGANVIFNLNRENNKNGHGEYIYTKYKKTIPITLLKIDDKLEITEFFNEESTANMYLEKKGQQYTGKWVNSKKSLPINLTKMNKSMSEIISNIDYSKSEHTISDDSFETQTELYLKFENGKKQIISYSDLTDSTERLNLIFEDLNFDSYPDLKILTYSGANPNYLIYLYSPEEHLFKKWENTTFSNPHSVFSEKIICEETKVNNFTYKLITFDTTKTTIFQFDYMKNEGFTEELEKEEKKYLSKENFKVQQDKCLLP